MPTYTWQTWTDRQTAIHRQTDRQVDMNGQTDRQGDMNGQTDRQGDMNGQTDRQGDMNGQTDRQGDMNGQTDRQGDMNGQTDRRSTSKNLLAEPVGSGKIISLSRVVKYNVAKSSLQVVPAPLLERGAFQHISKHDREPGGGDVVPEVVGRGCGHPRNLSEFGKVHAEGYNQLEFCSRVGRVLWWKVSPIHLMYRVRNLENC